MPITLSVATVLIVAIALLHSVLGERYLIRPLLSRSHLPPLLGDDRFTRGTVRFAWHLTSVAWWGLAAVLAAVADPVRIVGVTFAVSAVITAVATRLRHLAWVVFSAVAVLSLLR